MRREVRAQPFFLRRTGFAATYGHAFAVQYDNVPLSQFVAVVAGLGVSRRRAEIIKIRRRSRRMKLVIARSRPRAAFGAAPGLVVAIEILLATIRICEIAHGHHRARDSIE